MPQQRTPRHASGSSPSDAARLLAQCGAGSTEEPQRGRREVSRPRLLGPCEGVRRATKGRAFGVSRHTLHYTSIAGRPNMSRSLRTLLPTSPERRELSKLNNAPDASLYCSSSLRARQQHNFHGVSRHQSRHQRTKPANRQHALRAKSDGQRPSGPRTARHRSIRVNLFLS
jgi:hypothetical protein